MPRSRRSSASDSSAASCAIDVAPVRTSGPSPSAGGRSSRASTKPSSLVVVEAHGRREPVAARAAPRPAAGRSCRRWRRRRPSRARRPAACRRCGRRLRQHLVGGLGQQLRARSWSSRMAKPGGTPASSGKRCSSRSQKAWMVCTLRPPGVSMAMANSCRARCISSAVGARSSSSASLPSSSASSAVTHSASRANTRLDISAAAALV